MTVRLSTLGSLRVVRDGEEVDALRARRMQLALLTLIAVEREVTRDVLLGTFWGERDPERAGHSLSQALYQLKTELGDDWLRATGDMIRATDALEVDVLEFEEALARGDLVGALSMYDGPFLDGFISSVADFSHWAASKRARLQRVYRSVLQREVDARVAAGEEEGAVALARRWVESDPLDDEAQHRLIELVAASGRRGEALRHFEEYSALLAREDLRPLEETMDLVDEIREGGLTLSPSGLTARSEDPPLSPPEEAIHETRVLGGLPVSGPRLIRIAEGGEEAEAYALQMRKTVVGRRSGDITMPDDESVSDPHATIFVRSLPTDPGSAVRFVLRDEGSDSGVFLRIRGSWPLRDGDEFAAGSQRFRFEVGKG